MNCDCLRTSITNLGFLLICSKTKTKEIDVKNYVWKSIIALQPSQIRHLTGSHSLLLLCLSLFLVYCTSIFSLFSILFKACIATRSLVRNAFFYFVLLTTFTCSQIHVQYIFLSMQINSVGDALMNHINCNAHNRLHLFLFIYLFSVCVNVIPLKCISLNLKVICCH